MLSENNSEKYKTVKLYDSNRNDKRLKTVLARHSVYSLRNRSIWLLKLYTKKKRIM